MNKALSLFFAVTAVMFFIGIGMALSYRNLWIALLLAVGSILYIGLGFVIKARLRR